MSTAMDDSRDLVSEKKLQGWILEALAAIAVPSSAREVTLWLMEADKFWASVGLENRNYSLLRRLEDQGVVVSQGWKGAKKADYIWCRRFSLGTVLDRLGKL
jgi:hypothetical protein